MIVAPNSPIPRANESAQPAPSPPPRAAARRGRTCGPGRRRACGRRRSGRVDRLERRDRGAEVEGAGDEHDREDDGELGERRSRVRARRASRRAGRGDRKRRAARSRQPPAAARAGARRASRAATWRGNARDAIRYAAGVPNSRISAVRDQRRLQRHDAARRRGRVVQPSRSRPGGTSRKIARIGRRRNESVSAVASASATPNGLLTGARSRRSSARAWPSVPSRSATKLEPLPGSSSP